MRTRFRWKQLAPAAAGLALWIAPTVTFAQEASTVAASAQTEAEAAIAHGVALRQAGNDDEALAEFRRADQLAPSPRTKAQIALAEQALGQWVAAERDLRAALASAEDPWIQRNREALNAALVQIAGRLGWLEVRSSAPGAELYINEERVAALPLSEPVRLPVGTASLEVRAPGYTSQRRSVEVTAGGRVREVFTLAAARNENTENRGQPSGETTSGATSDAPLARGAQGASVPVGPIVVMGVGVVSLGLSGMFAALRGGAFGACPYDAATDTLRCNGADAVRRAQAGVGYTTGVNVTLIGGAVVLAGGGAWLVASLLARPTERAPRAMVVPTAGTDGASLNVVGRF
ncbi:MAG: PEGA domain-containing protein [Polyangiales bacterium]